MSCTPVLDKNMERKLSCYSGRPIVSNLVSTPRVNLPSPRAYLTMRWGFTSAETMALCGQGWQTIWTSPWRVFVDSPAKGLAVLTLSWAYSCFLPCSPSARLRCQEAWGVLVTGVLKILHFQIMKTCLLFKEILAVMFCVWSTDEARAFVTETFLLKVLHHFPWFRQLQTNDSVLWLSSVTLTYCDASHHSWMKFKRRSLQA